MTKIDVNYVPSEYEAINYIHFTSRSLLRAVQTKGTGVIHGFVFEGAWEHTTNEAAEAFDAMFHNSLEAWDRMMTSLKGNA